MAKPGAKCVADVTTEKHVALAPTNWYLHTIERELQGQKGARNRFHQGEITLFSSHPLSRLF
jgi:hypothetical protein